VEGVGHNIPNIDGLDSIIRREPPSPVSELVSFGTKLEASELEAFGAPNPCPKKPRLISVPSVRRIHLADSACRKLAVARYTYHPKSVFLLPLFMNARFVIQFGVTHFVENL
jgi:hypothetical protein